MNSKHELTINNVMFSSSRWLATFLSLAFVLLPGPDAGTAENAPQLQPGHAFTIPFPDLPATFTEMLDPKGVQPMMTVFLPRNYQRQRKHPLLIFLGGGGGSRGQNPVVARKLTEETDFVCAAGAKASLPEMAGVGHAFPESQYPAVRARLRDGCLQ